MGDKQSKNHYTNFLIKLNAGHVYAMGYIVRTLIGQGDHEHIEYLAAKNLWSPDSVDYKRDVRQETRLSSSRRLSSIHSRSFY